MTPNLNSFVDELVKISEEMPRIVVDAAGYQHDLKKLREVIWMMRDRRRLEEEKRYGEKTAGTKTDILRSLALRAAPGAAVGAGIGGVRGAGDEGVASGAAKGALMGALLGIPMSHGADRLGAFAGKHLAAREVAKHIATKPYHRLTAAQRKAFVDAIGDHAKPAQDLVAAKLRRAGAIGAGVAGGVAGTRD